VTPANTQWVIYDLSLSRLHSNDFWFVPWLVKSTAIAVGQKSVTDSENKLFVTLWDGTNTRIARMNIDATDYEDLVPADGSGATFNWSLTTSLLGVPEGDHVNKLRAPDFSPALASVQVERLSVNGDTDPSVSVYYDDFFNTPVDLVPGDVPARRDISQGYVSLTYNKGVKVCKHAAVVVTGVQDTLGAELYQLALNWLPESGA
jgi:hypothetical protein